MQVAHHTRENMKKKMTYTGTALLLFFLSTLLPLVSFATSSTTTDSPKEFRKLIDSSESLTLILERIVGVMIIVVFIGFFFSLLKHMFDSGGKDDKSASGLAWSVVTFFIFISLWGIIAWMEDILGIDRNASGGYNEVVPVPST